MLQYYASGAEAQRLQQGLGRVEFVRTQEILSRHLPEPPAEIYDVGGGTGAYAFWLARQGFQVHLLELSPENVKLAEKASAGQPGQPLAAIEVADALALPRPDESADAVLLLGPLYHLPQQEDRFTALGEAMRVLRPQGLLAAAAITRFGSALYGLSTYGQSNWLMDQPAFMAMVRRELADGQHIPPFQLPGLFTRAFFHHPQELKQEIAQAGFMEPHVLAVEGPSWIIPNLAELWVEEEKQARILEVVRALEDEPSLVGMSPHLLGIARKPG
jgi:ubiquinone/menaquinone biosynthesis C-methylase UbiE